MLTLHWNSRPALLLAALLLAPVAIDASVPALFPSGDANEDGVVDVADAFALIQHLEGDAPLAGRGLFEVDLAPIQAGASVPDLRVDVGDLVVLLRLLAGEFATAAPTLDATTIPANPTQNPIPSLIEGDAPPNSQVHLYVRSSSGETVHVASVTSDGSGAFSFSDVPMLFDGTNEFFVVVLDAVTGFASAPSVSQVATNNIAAQTDPPLALAPGTTVWTAHSGDFVPSGSFVVPSGSKLVLGPGVTVRFPNAADSLVVNDTLHAFGAVGSPVTFTSDGAWDGLEFVDTASEYSVLSHAVVERIRAGSSGVFVHPSNSVNTTVAIRHTLIDATSAAANGIWARNDGARVIVDFSTVVGQRSNQANGLHLESSRASVVRHSAVSSFVRGIYFRGFSQDNVSNTTVSDCTTGLYFDGSRAIVAPGNVISGNTTGMFFFPRGSGPSCGMSTCWSGGDRFARIQDSTIVNNGRNLTATSARWRASNGLLAVIDVRRNYWGFETPSGIASKIRDVTGHLSGSSTGQVSVGSIGALADFTPFARADGTLDYSAVSGHMHGDFTPGAAAVSQRTAVGPMLLRKGRVATVPAGTTVTTYVPDDPQILVPIYISGTLVVEGEIGSEVEFSRGGSTNRAEWWGFLFDSDSAGSDLDHLSVHNTVEAIRATNTDISIDSADVKYFSNAGIVLDNVHEASSVTNSTVSGLLVAGPPEVSVIDDADMNVVGIDVVNSFMGCAQGTTSGCGSVSGNVVSHLVTGISVSGSDPFVLGNTLSDNTTGMHVLDASSPSIDAGNLVASNSIGVHIEGNSSPGLVGNSITNNLFGIWLHATADGEPFPRINQNTIMGNSGSLPPLTTYQGTFRVQTGTRFRYCSLAGGANLCLSGFPPGFTSGSTPDVIDATENYWGTTDAAEVAALVRVDEDQEVALNLEDFTNSSGTPAFPGAPLFSSLIVDVTTTTGNPNGHDVLSPIVDGESATIEFELVSSATFVRLEIYREGMTNGGTVLYTDEMLNPSAGDHSFTWDGTDTSTPGGNVFAEGTYAYVLTASTPQQTDVYDRARNETAVTGSGSVILGDVGRGAFDSTVEAEFDPFANDHLEADYLFVEQSGRGAPFSSRVSAEVYRRPTISELCDSSGTNQDPANLVATPWRDKGVWIGSQPFIWDGRADDTSGPAFAAGEIVPDPGLTDGGGLAVPGFCLFFDVPAALQKNHLIVVDTDPVLTNAGQSPNVEVLSDPYLIYPTYEQTSLLKFNVDRDSSVKVYILAPGVEFNSSSPTFVDEYDFGDVTGVGPMGTDLEYEWKVYSDGSGETNLLDTTENGPYTFAIEAKLIGNPSVATTFRGVVQVLGQ